MDKNANNEIAKLRKEFEDFKRKYAIHQHDNIDGTNMLRKNIFLDRDQWLAIGNNQQITRFKSNGATTDSYEYYSSSGPDSVTTGFVNKSNNVQLNLFHYPNTDNSFVTAYRKTIATNFEGTTTSVTSAQNTITINGFNFATNELAGSVINIYDSSFVHIETQSIASNTATVVTIDGTWANTTNNGYFFIYRPVYLGSADHLWQRVSIGGEDVSSGGTFAQLRVLRFGYGTTAGTNTIGIFMGTGSPLNVVTANTGSLYLRTDGSTSTTLYVKTADDGASTGWTAK